LSHTTSPDIFLIFKDSWHKTGGLEDWYSQLLAMPSLKEMK
jgi:hypothetical protein